MPGGNRFKATVELILQREQNWVCFNCSHFVIYMIAMLTIFTLSYPDKLEDKILSTLRKASTRRGRQIQISAKQASSYYTETETIPLQDG